MDQQKFLFIAGTMQDGTATLKDCLAVSHETKHDLYHIMLDLNNENLYPHRVYT